MDMLPRPLVACLTLLAFAAASTGCVLRGDHRKLAYTIDGAAVAVGAGATLKAETADCGDGFEGFACDIDSGMLEVAGITLLTLGLFGALMTYSVNADLPDDAEADAEEPPAWLVAGPPAETPPFCARLIDGWRAERDPDRKIRRYQAMPTVCRTMLTPHGAGR
jgi:hypothetical protein